MFQNLFNKKNTSEKAGRGSPIDKLFAEHFSNKGGKFIYCTAIQETIGLYSNILEENNWTDSQGVCYSEKLISGLSDVGIVLNHNKKKSHFLVTHCESLIADTGSVLVCSRQISERKISDLPDSLIIFASTSQIVRTLSEGLKVINSQGAIPSNITTIDNFSTEKKDKQGLLNYMGTSKHVYLLLVEDL